MMVLNWFKKMSRTLAQLRGREREKVSERERKRLVRSWGTRCWKWSQMKQGRQMSTFFLIFFLLFLLLLSECIFSFFSSFVVRTRKGGKRTLWGEGDTRRGERTLREDENEPYKNISIDPSWDLILRFNHCITLQTVFASLSLFRLDFISLSPSVSERETLTVLIPFLQ